MDLSGGASDTAGARAASASPPHCARPVAGHTAALVRVPVAPRGDGGGTPLAERADDRKRAAKNGHPPMWGSPHGRRRRHLCNRVSGPIRGMAHRATPSAFGKPLKSNGFFYAPRRAPEPLGGALSQRCDMSFDLHSGWGRVDGASRQKVPRLAPGRPCITRVCHLTWRSWHRLCARGVRFGSCRT